MKDPVQEQLIAARRNQILDAAAKVFAVKGFHPTTIRDIAREAGIADGTIYNYFDNKTALLLSIFDRMRESVNPGDIVAVLDVPPRDFLKTYLGQPLMGVKVDNFALFRVVVSEMMVNDELKILFYEKVFEPAITLAEAYFEYWVQQGHIQPARVGLTVRAVVSMVFGLILANVMGDSILDENWDTLPDFLADMILDGIGINSP